MRFQQISTKNNVKYICWLETLLFMTIGTEQLQVFEFYKLNKNTKGR